MCKALELAEELFNTSEEIRTEWKGLRNKQSIADQKISDVEHFIELSSNLNAAQGYNAYKLLKEVLEERREIKNRIDELGPLLSFINKTTLVNPNKKISLIKDLNRVKDRNNNADEVKKYNVRILTDIFGDTIKQNI